MCGRFVQFDISLPVIANEAVVTNPNYNVAPSQEISAIINIDGQNKIATLNWGLVPFWARDRKIGNRLINARMETITEKPAFRTAFKKRRCLIPTSGFYEWVTVDGQKQPYYITPKAEKAFAFAGLWEVWDKEDTPYRSCVIITHQSIKIHHTDPSSNAGDLEKGIS